MNRVGAYRGARRALLPAVGAALYQGGMYAYQNRKVAGQIGAAARKLLSNKRRKVGPQRAARRFGQGSNGTTNVGSSDPALVGNEVSTYRSKVGRYPQLRPSRLLELVQAGMNSTVWRAQGLTNADTNVGFYPLANRQSLDLVPLVNLPVHVWDLSIFPNVNPEVQAGSGYYWTSDAAAANLTSFSLQTQTPSGATSGPYYHAESAAGFAESGTAPNATKACHEWSSVKLLLYGARKRGTRFYIDLVRVKNELAHPLAGSGVNKSKKDLFRSLQSNLIYSSLQQHNGRNMADVSFVKRYQFYVPGGSADDLDTIGKTKEVTVFYKSGRVYNMAWESSDAQEALPHTQADGADYTLKGGPQDHPRNAQRLLLIVRAFSPERRSVAAAVMGTEPADPLTEPSYDIVIRNKWMLPA